MRVPLEYGKTNQADNPLPPSTKSDTENEVRGNISNIQLRTIEDYESYCSFHHHINIVFIILIHIR